MTKLFLILCLTFSVSNLSAQNNVPPIKPTDKSFPTNLDEQNFKKLNQFDQKVVAFDGIIEKIKKSRKNTPFYKLRIGSTNYLWTALLFNNKGSKIGDTIRVVGYLNRPQPNEAEKKFLDGKYVVLAFGLVDFKNQNFLFLQKARRQQNEWVEGKIPTSK
jgi:hypothetical protein